MATVVFFTPHQDDETLAFGPAVRDHLNAVDASGHPLHDVHIVLMTTGQNSGVFGELTPPLSVADFVAARDDEMLRATRQVGVRTANVHISPLRVEDGALTVEVATSIIQEFYEQFPGAWCKCYSPLDIPGKHPDHLACGQAAAALAAPGGPISNQRFYVEPWLAGPFRTAHPSVTLALETVADTTAVERGFAQYALADPVAGMYAIGEKSVGHEFAEDNPPASYYHVPTS